VIFGVEYSRQANCISIVAWEMRAAGDAACYVSGRGEESGEGEERGEEERKAREGHEKEK